MSQDKADEIEERLIGFAVRTIKLATSLPKSPVGLHIAGQILRSGTSPAPNYAEARGAESRADFIHKLRIVVKELNETSVWLRIIKGSDIIREERLGDLNNECNQLSKLLQPRYGRRGRNKK